MITAWLAVLDGLKDLLTGKTVLQPFWGNREEEGINLKKLLEDPPAWLDFQALIRGRLPEKYMEKGKPAPVEILFQLQSVFNLPTGWAYPAWFN
jgi:hypothetical protein